MSTRLTYFFYETSKLVMIVLIFTSCGQANFTGQSQVSPPVNQTLLLGGTSYYLELGQQFPSGVSGTGIVLNLLEIFAQATWSGASALTLEVRLTFAGTVGVGGTSFTGTTPPSGWPTGTVVFNQSITAGSVVNNLQSSNLSSVIDSMITRQEFWIDVRAQAAGGDTPNTVNLTNINAYAAGTKNLQNFSPLLNLYY